MKSLNTEDLAAFCKKKGFIFQSSDIYGGLSGFFDYGPLGVELKNNIKNVYWKDFVVKREDVVGLDSSIISNPKVWKASGHVDTFGDLILTTEKSKTKLRADHFIEDTLNIPGDGLSAEEINELIKKHNLKYKGEDFEEVKDFNLMFQTNVGADTSKKSVAYLRPETCQGIFTNFRLVADSSRLSLPFGIVQVGKAFRNEISPRDFLFRCREFEQIEMEYFINPEKDMELSEDVLNTKIQFLSAEAQEKNKDMKEITIKELLKNDSINNYHAYWLANFYNWFMKLGLSYKNLRVREHLKTELSHYSSATLDIDYKYPFGYKEVLGLANRGDFDLKQHQTHSKTKLELFDEASQKKILPHVIEPSLGLERIFMAVIHESYKDDKERGNVLLSLPSVLSPYKVSVHPLVKKDVLVSKAKKLFEELIDNDIPAYYDEKASIGRRYARQDEIGTRLNVTVDFESVEEGKNKGTITIRDRDTTEQVRVKEEDFIKEIISMLK